MTDQTPKTAMDELREFVRSQSDTNILRLALGIPIPGAPRLAKHLIVNCIDCESFEHKHSLLTEIGLVAFESQHARATIEEPGPHALNVLKQMWFYHFRILANAHYINQTFCPGNPESNRFGFTRFITDAEAKGMLTESFAWPNSSEEAESKNCPVIFLGHAIGNDLSMLYRSTGFDADELGNVVAIIDTQRIAEENGIRGQGNQIGLRVLCQRMGFEFRDSHTAGNDAAYTMIGAVLMALQDRLPQENVSLSAQKMVDELEVYSREARPPHWGISRYCTRCGLTNHLRPDCRAKVKCDVCLKARRWRAMKNHRTHLCPWTR